MKTTPKKTLLTLPLLILPSLVLADVNVRDGDFSKSFEDFSFRRTYHSHSLEIGAFGFGWCSEWDTTLDLKSDNTGILSSCENPQTQSVSVKKQGVFWKVQRGSTTLLFAKNGLLTVIKNSRGDVHADRDSKTQFIQSLRSSHGEKIQFQYDDQNLIHKNSNQGIREKYEYDELHNMTEVSEWKKSQWQVTDHMTYDTGRDLALGTVSANGCVDSFTYLRSSRLETSTVVQRQCPGQSLQILKYQFTYQAHTDGTISLNRMSVKSESRTTQLFFNTRTGENQLDGGLR